MAFTKNPAPDKELICAACGETFFLANKWWKKRLKLQAARGNMSGNLFCSQACSNGTGHNRKHLPPWQVGDKPPALQTFVCECGATFCLLSSTAQLRLLSGRKLYCSRSCAATYATFWPTFVKSPEELAELARWEQLLKDEGLGMDRGIDGHIFYGHSTAENGAEMWATDPNKQRQFAYGASA